MLQDLKDFSCVCVTDTGALGGKLLGVVGPMDIDFVNDRQQTLSEVMDRCVNSLLAGMQTACGTHTVGAICAAAAVHHDMQQRLRCTAAVSVP